MQFITWAPPSLKGHETLPQHDAVGWFLVAGPGRLVNIEGNIYFLNKCANLLAQELFNCENSLLCVEFQG